MAGLTLQALDPVPGAKREMKLKIEHAASKDDEATRKLNRKFYYY